MSRDLAQCYNKHINHTIKIQYSKPVAYESYIASLVKVIHVKVIQC